MRMKKKLGVMAAAFGLAYLTVPLVAHHGFDTEYDGAKKVTLTGVVTKIEWTNPHMHIYIDVADADGKVANWNMEMASPNTVQRQGWKQEKHPGGRATRWSSKATEARWLRRTAPWRKSPRRILRTNRCLSKRRA